MANPHPSNGFKKGRKKPANSGRKAGTLNHNTQDLKDALLNAADAVSRNGENGDIPVFLSGGGEMGARMRAHDWSATPLGVPETWPQSLRTVVRILLTSRYQMWMGWGEALSFFYNDAYRPTGLLAALIELDRLYAKVDRNSTMANPHPSNGF